MSIKCTNCGSFGTYYTHEGCSVDHSDLASAKACCVGKQEEKTMNDVEWQKFLMDTIDEQREQIKLLMTTLKLAMTLIETYKADAKAKIKELENES